MKIKDIMANTDSILGWAMMAKPEREPELIELEFFYRQSMIRCGQLENQVSELTKLIYKIVEDMQDENRQEESANKKVGPNPLHTGPDCIRVSEEWVNRDIYNELQLQVYENDKLREQLADAQTDGDAFDQVEASHLLLALENKELLEENSELTDKINHYQSFAQGLEIDFRNVQKNYLELNDEKVAGDEHIRDIETELTKAWNENQLLREDIGELQETNENYADAIDRLEKDNRIQRKIRSNMCDANSELNDKHVETMNEINNIKEQLVGVRASVKMLKKAIHDASA